MERSPGSSCHARSARTNFCWRHPLADDKFLKTTCSTAKTDGSKSRFLKDFCCQKTMAEREGFRLP